MEIILNLLSSIISALSAPLPGAGFWIIIAIIVVASLGRSKLKAHRAKVRELETLNGDLIHSLEINRKIHQEGEQSLMGKSVQLQQELEDARSEIRILQDQPKRREWMRLKRCETVVKQLATCDSRDPERLDKVCEAARLELVECPVGEEGDKRRGRSILGLPIFGGK